MFMLQLTVRPAQLFNHYQLFEFSSVYSFIHYTTNTIIIFQINFEKNVFYFSRSWRYAIRPSSFAYLLFTFFLLSTKYLKLQLAPPDQLNVHLEQEIKVHSFKLNKRGIQRTSKMILQFQRIQAKVMFDLRPHLGTKMVKLYLTICTSYLHQTIQVIIPRQCYVTYLATKQFRQCYQVALSHQTIQVVLSHILSHQTNQIGSAQSPTKPPNNLGSATSHTKQF